MLALGALLRLADRVRPSNTADAVVLGVALGLGFLAKSFLAPWAIVCFVTVKQGIAPDDALKDELKKHVVKDIGALARPDDIRFTDTLPKTRSGKIMRRLLRDIAEDRELGDVSTLTDASVMGLIQAKLPSPAGSED